MGDDRREQVLTAALSTFARYGYRKTSMDDVARDAGISRPGLYFLFASKPDLFRAAVTQALEHDVEGARRALADTGRPLRERLVEAFDHWAGRYIGPMASEVPLLLESHPELLEPIVTEYPERFAGLVAEAVAAGLPRRAAARAGDAARTLLSTAAGIKHEAATRADFRARLTIAVDLILAGAAALGTDQRP